MPWGGPRFYPPGEHPATYQLREHRRRLAEWLDRMDPRSSGYADCWAAIAYDDRKLAEFEAGEYETKRIWWHWHRERSRRPRSPRA